MQVVVTLEKHNKIFIFLKPTKVSPTEPGSIPLGSFVIDIDGEKKEENAESVMLSSKLFMTVSSLF